MSGWLLDTNILSELKRPQPEPKVLAFMAEHPLETFFVSTVTLAEIRFGIEQLVDPARRALLEDWLAHRIRPQFGTRVLPVSEDVMLRWRLVVEEGRKKRHTFSQPDLIIAATALEYGLVLVTRNTSDYAETRVPLRNPWVD